jgi:microcystin-dependent protein
MRREWLRLGPWAACALALSSALVARAAQTGLAGGAQPVSNMQPSLGMNYLIRLDGPANQLGEVVPFAGSFPPAGWAFAQGQSLPIAQNAALFQRLGTTYGGNGVATFALPDLRGRTAIHRGAGTGLTNRPLGSTAGVEATTLTFNNMPAHGHPLPGGGMAFSAGGPGLPFGNMQPSLALNYAIALNGNFPSEGVAQSPTWFGQVRMFAGETPAIGYASADGQLLPIAQNTSLFALLGTRYGGNGQTTFALPDLRSRASIHAGSADGVTNHALASTAGSETVTLAANQLATHAHSVLPPANMTDPAGDGQPFNNLQPSLALNYVICTQGNFPTPGLGATEPFLGQVALFAGDFAPRNWAFANGQTLPIAQNTSLFALLGTAYGGNGQTTFALPDLQGRVIVGAGQGAGLTERSVGDEIGAVNTALTANQLPLHTHPYAGFDADFDGNLKVDGADMLKWQRGLGGSPAPHEEGDANFDGDVDAFDFAVWKAQFGGAPPSPSAEPNAVPEPASACVAAIGFVAAAAARARRRL